MATYVTEGVVLKYYSYRDNDRLFTIYTKEYGKTEVIGRGTNKLISKLAGHLEPFTQSLFMIATGRRWDVLAQARTISSYPNIKISLRSLSSVSVIGEAIDTLTKQMQQDERLYNFFLTILDAWNRKEPEKSAMYGSLWKVLMILGYSPRLESCVFCNNVLQDSVVPFFSFLQGGFLCARCVAYDPEAWIVSNDAFVWLTHSLSTQEDDQSSAPHSHKELERATLRLIAYYYQYILGDNHIPKSLRFFKYIWPSTV